MRARVLVCAPSGKVVPKKRDLALAIRELTMYDTRLCFVPACHKPSASTLLTGGHMQAKNLKKQATAKARSAALTPAQRSKIAAKAALNRLTDDVRNRA